jgi:DNA-directed RNA polymerase subunit RPC12/RpoP
MKTFICKNCGARFTGKDVESFYGNSGFRCPKCGKRNAEIFEERNFRKKKWKTFGELLFPESSNK